MKTIRVKANTIVSGDNILNNNARCKVISVINGPGWVSITAQSEKFQYLLEYFGNKTVKKIIK